MSAILTGNFYCLWYLGSGRDHQEYFTTKKFTTYRRTRDCCGDLSAEVINVQYWQGYCYQPLPYSCSPAGPPPACLAF